MSASRRRDGGSLLQKKIDSFDDERHYALFSCARDVTRRERIEKEPGAFHLSNLKRKRGSNDPLRSISTVDPSTKSFTIFKAFKTIAQTEFYIRVRPFEFFI